MDYSSDWLLRLVEEYKRKHAKHPCFISDWDITGPKVEFPISLINSSLISAKNTSLKYLFAEDLDKTKKQVCNLLKTNGIKASTNNLTITASATTSIYAALLSIQRTGITRFLVFTPTYYTILDTLKDLKVTFVYFPLFDYENFKIHPEKLNEVIESQDIEAIIFSDSIYSAGIEVPERTYTDLARISRERNLWLICDHTLGGLEWASTSFTVLPYAKIKALFNSDKFILIDSITKQMLINGIKNSIVITNTKLIGEIENTCSQIYGGLNSPQIELFKELYLETNADHLSQIMRHNVSIIKSNYALIKSMLIGTNYALYKANSGYFTMIAHRSLRIKNVNSKSIIRKFLTNENLLALPAFHFSYHPQNKFAFRVNLLADLSAILPTLEKCIRKDVERFQ